MNKSNLREEIFKLVYSLEVQKDDESSQIDLYLENSELSDKEKGKIKEEVCKIIDLKEDIENQANLYSMIKTFFGNYYFLIILFFFSIDVFLIGVLIFPILSLPYSFDFRLDTISILFTFFASSLFTIIDTNNIPRNDNR